MFSQSSFRVYIFKMINVNNLFNALKYHYTMINFIPSKYIYRVMSDHTVPGN